MFCEKKYENTELTRLRPSFTQIPNSRPPFSDIRLRSSDPRYRQIRVRKMLPLFTQQHILVRITLPFPALRNLALRVATQLVIIVQVDWKTGW